MDAPVIALEQALLDALVARLITGFHEDGKLNDEVARAIARQVITILGYAKGLRFYIEPQGIIDHDLVPIRFSDYVGNESWVNVNRDGSIDQF